eukprot:10488375-Lingulodinium_polyedra.AAC.1
MTMRSVTNAAASFPPLAVRSALSAEPAVLAIACRPWEPRMTTRTPPPRKTACSPLREAGHLSSWT